MFMLSGVVVMVVVVRYKEVGERDRARKTTTTSSNGAIHVNINDMRYPTLLGGRCGGCGSCGGSGIE